jgi:iron(III) transport system permease protein
MAPWRVALSVPLRRSLGAIAGAALAVAVLTAGDMTVTDLLSIRTYAEEAYIQVALRRGPATVAMTALPPLLVLGGLIVVAAAWLLRSDPSRIVSTSTHAPPWRLGKWRIVAGLLVGIFLAAFVGLPLYSLLWRAGRVGGNARLGIAPYWSVPGLIGTLRASVSDVLGSNPRHPLRGPLAASLLWGSVGAAGSVALAWSLAWSARKPGPWRWITAFAVAIALATPGPVAGMAMVLAYRSVGPVYDSPAIVVLTYIMRTWPYALLLLWPAVRGLPGEYFEAAEVEGHGPFGQALRIALPLTLASIGLAWGASSVLAFGELPATNLVLPPGHTTLTKRIWDLLHIGVESRLAGIALVTLAFFALSGLAVVLGFAWRASRGKADSWRRISD